MTPEELIEKHKQRINEFLQKDDQDILNAYVTMRIKQETKKVKFFAKTSDMAAAVGLITVGSSVIIALISLIIFGFSRDTKCTNYNAERDVAVQTAKNEGYTVKKELETKLSESQTLFQACQDEQAKLQKVCIENLMKSAE